MSTRLFEPGAPDVLYVVDLSSYVLRAYHAIAPLSNPAGEPTHATYGTVTMLERLVRERRPALLAVAMDSGRKTFRKELFEGYKANRPPAPDDLRVQLERCRDFVRAFAIPALQQEGVEADDLIACAVKQAREHGLKVVIVGADKDLMQLVGEDVVLWDTMRDKVYGREEVEARFGVPIAKLRDLLALCGDTSDNIPGVVHVGPKTARDLLLEFDTLEGIYGNLETLSKKKKKLAETLAENREQAFLSQKLVTLREDCAIDFDLERLRYGGRDIPMLRKLYAELGFQRQLNALDTTPEPELVAARSETSARSAIVEVASTPPARLETLLDERALSAAVERARQSRRLVFALEPASAMHATVVAGLAFATEPGTGFYVPLAHRYVGMPAQLAFARAAELFGPFLADASIEKGAHDLKRVEVSLARHGMAFRGARFDAHLASYLLDPEARHDLENLAERELGTTLSSRDELTRRTRTKGIDFDEVPIEQATQHAAGRVEAVLRLWDRLLPRVNDEGLGPLYQDVELPLTSMLAGLELTGVLVDVDRLAVLSRQMHHELERLEKEAHRIAGKPFNVNSPRQLETLLFDELGLKPLKRTKTSRSTDAATLEALAEEHELCRVILEHRQIAKLKGTYVDALPLLVDPKTGRIHTSWEQAVAATGRLSSTDPNLQNIPIRSALGRPIREAFVAPPGHRIVSADYSQIELRVLAHLSEDPVLLDAFRTGQDIHTRTAMEIFEVSESELTREMRTRAKAVNFGVIYGQGDSGLAKSIGISRNEAESFIAAYFRRYEGVRRFMNQTLLNARASETVRSMLGRRRILPDIGSGNRARRLAAERIAMNMPIQGTAADLLKLSMLALREPPTPGTRMVLTVHDELVFEVPEAEVDEAKARIKHAMQNVYPLSVPLVVDVADGPNWNAAK
jgi:DNA polymerase-1